MKGSVSGSGIGPGNPGSQGPAMPDPKTYPYEWLGVWQQSIQIPESTIYRRALLITKKHQKALKEYMFKVMSLWPGITTLCING